MANRGRLHSEVTGLLLLDVHFLFRVDEDHEQLDQAKGQRENEH